VIIAKFYKRSHFNPCFEVYETRRFGNAKVARLWAQSKLPAISATTYTYHRDIGRADFVELYRDGKRIETVEPECRIVASVGELGWTP
jgi:hypothetical protein